MYATSGGSDETASSLHAYAIIIINPKLVQFSRILLHMQRDHGIVFVIDNGSYSTIGMTFPLLLAMNIMQMTIR